MSFLRRCRRPCIRPAASADRLLCAAVSAHGVKLCRGAAAVIIKKTAAPRSCLPSDRKCRSPMQQS